MIVRTIGVIRTPYKSKERVPIQPSYSEAIGEVEVFDEYAPGLKDIEGFSHVILLYLFHESPGPSLLVRPFLDSAPRGVFATRHPDRPNPIGLSIVRLIKRKGNVLFVKGIDTIDGTPLVDVKPYVPAYDEVADAKVGWLEGKLHPQ